MEWLFRLFRRPAPPMSRAEAQAAISAHYRHLLDLSDRGGWRYANELGEEAQMEWQPIETAPKDGASVLIGRAQWPEPFVAHLEDGRWYIDGEDEPFDFAPTHWMPLPDAPKD